MPTPGNAVSWKSGTAEVSPARSPAIHRGGRRIPARMAPMASRPPARGSAPSGARLRELARRAVAAALGLGAGLVVLVAVEIQLARSGHRLPEPKLELDR